MKIQFLLHGFGLEIFESLLPQEVQRLQLQAGHYEPWRRSMRQADAAFTECLTNVRILHNGFDHVKTGAQSNSALSNRPAAGIKSARLDA
jgi:hypothetical protein